MHLVQLLLPLYSNSGIPFDQVLFIEVRNELVERFGGITTHTRAPVDGLWQESERVVRDDLVIYEIMVDTLDEGWWREYRALLEKRFQQESLVVRTYAIRVL